MGWKRRVAVALTMAAAFDGFVACYDWDLAVDGGADGSIGASGDGASGDGALDANDLDVVVPEGGCTLSPAHTCGPGFVCTFPDHKCGSGDLVGKCVQPGVCSGPQELESVSACGCNGQLYKNQCAAGQAGQDLSVTGSCAGDVDGSFFQCGFTFCERVVEFCVSNADGGFGCDKYDCADAAGGTGLNNCACAKAQVCANGTCPGTTSGSTPALTLDCP